MNTFPNVEAYLILGDAGAGTNFIKNIMASLIYNNEIKISEKGHTHQVNYYENFSAESRKSASNTHSMEKELLYEPENEAFPFFIRSHNNYFNLIGYRKKFPKGKVVVIQTEIKYFMRIMLNILVKNITDMHEQKLVSPNYQLRWASYVKDYDFLKNKKTPMELSTKDYEIILKDKLQKFLKDNKSLRFSPDVLFGLDFDDKLILKISYDNLLNNMDKTLEDISKFINRPINEVSYKNYQNYLIAQESLVQKYAPWLSELEKLN